MKNQIISWGAVLCCLLGWVGTRASVFYVDVNSTNPTPPYADWSTAATDIQSAVDLSTNGDRIWVNDGVYASGWRLASDGITNRVVVTNAITLQSVNGSSATVIDGRHAMRCVYLSTNAVLSGFTLTNAYVPSWVGGGVYCISSNALVLNCRLTGNFSEAGGGEYGGIASNCFLIGNTASFEGGGAAYCTLSGCFLAANLSNQGGGASRCVLVNCIISNNVALSTNLPLFPPSFSVGLGGGTFRSALRNCIIVSNSAAGSSSEGGGICDGTLLNCSIQGNSASSNGGGCVGGVILTNCVIMGNVAANGGGVYLGTYGTGNLFNCTVCSNLATNQGGGMWGINAHNSIIYYNFSPVGSNFAYSVSASPGDYCCIWPNFFGNGNFTNAPQFVDLVNGDFHLQSNSSCINAGNNAYVNNRTNDFDGNPRIVGETVDVGAYEYQSPVSKISYLWLEQYGLPINTNTDTSDADGTGMNNWQKWIAGLNPTNPASVLAMLPTVTNNIGGVTVSWQSVNTRTYYLQRATNFAAMPPFTAIQSNLTGQAGITSFTDTTATNGGPYFYRVGVQ